MVNVEFIDWVLEGMDDMYCDGFIDGWNAQAEISEFKDIIADIIPWHDGNYYCSACGCMIDPIFDYCCHCGAALDSRLIL